MKSYVSAFLLLTIADAVYAKSRSGVRGSKSLEDNHEQRNLRAHKVRISKIGDGKWENAVFSGANGNPFASKVKLPNTPNEKDANEWDEDLINPPASAQDGGQSANDENNEQEWNKEQEGPATAQDEGKLINDPNEIGSHPWDQQYVEAAVSAKEESVLKDEVNLP